MIFAEVKSQDAVHLYLGLLSSSAYPVWVLTEKQQIMTTDFFSKLNASLSSWRSLWEQKPPDVCQSFWKYYQLDQLPGNGHLVCWPFEQWHLAVHVWTPLQSARGTVLIWHGLFDHFAIYRKMIALALIQGFQVIGLDLPGHGLSDGQRASIDDFSSYQRILEGFFSVLEVWRCPQPWHALGQSTGSAILWEYLLRSTRNSQLTQIMLLAPLVRPAAFAQVRWSYRTLGKWLKATPRKFRVNSSDKDFIRFTHVHDPLQPRHLDMRWVGAMLEWEQYWRHSSLCSDKEIQIVQGGRDDTVDWAYNLAYLHRRFPAARILFLDEASHQLANESDVIRQPLDQRLAYMLNRSLTPTHV